ncbi:MFS polyamine transporter [Schizopora paradoxa]|uniref:MFS polyamine transporter n=1 Tax=Schizopora paradoxa TaxID=27342 RepID=A0A0H2RCL8_9AGAM|nr:MFS polyamine transporter [Schizopora paradoxa]
MAVDARHAPSSTSSPPLGSKPLGDFVEGQDENTVVDTNSAQDNDNHGVSNTDDSILVDFDGPDDPYNPRNWSFKKKWGVTSVISAFSFMSSLTSSMIAPASHQIAEKFGQTNTVIIAMYTSIFILAYAIGPLVLGPLSEIFGRAVIIQCSNIFYMIWNIACSFAQNTQELIVFRFFAGFGGSAPLTVGGGVLGDIWSAEERGRAIALYSLAPLLGPVIGPIAGAWIAQRVTWRWVFWSTSIANVFVQALGFLYLRETFPPILLERKKERMRKELIEQGNNEKADKLRTPYEGDARHWSHLFAKSIIRPFALFICEPIIQLLGIYMAFIYGTIYLVLTTLPSIYQGTYGESSGIAGLHYIALGSGMTLASQTTARLMDTIYIALSERAKNRWVAEHGGNGEEGGEKKSEVDRKAFAKPEFRLPTMVLGTFFLPAGLLMSGWGAQEHVHWILSDFGIAFIGAGMILNFLSIQMYVIDAFTLHAASALAAVAFLRSICGYGFPLFAPAMYAKLGFGKGDTILAVCAIVIGCPAPWLFWKYGERIRKASRYAKNG